MEAVRFGLFAERAMSILAYWRDIQATPLDLRNPDPGAIARKVIAADMVKELESVLYPQDDDG